MVEIELTDTNDDYLDMDEDDYVHDGHWWLLVNNIVAFVEDQNQWGTYLLADMDEKGLADTLFEVNRYALRLVDGLCLVQAELNSSNRAAGDFAPPSFSSQLAKMRTSVFNCTVFMHRRQIIESHWPRADVEIIENVQKLLRSAYLNSTAFKSVIQLRNHKTDFKEAWDTIPGAFAYHLCRFAGE